MDRICAGTAILNAAGFLSLVALPAVTHFLGVGHFDPRRT